MGADAVSIDLLIREHSAFVARLARRLLADPAAADDLSQDAWRAVLERRPRGITDFRAWITGLLRNLARMRMRTDAARRAREEATLPCVAERPDHVVAHLDEVERLVGALRRLREPFRSAILLRYREGATPRAIARQTGVSVETVKSRLKRGLTLLRADLRAAHGGSDQAWRSALFAVLLRRPARHGPLLASAGAAAAVLAAVAVMWGSLAAPAPERTNATAASPSAVGADRGARPSQEVAARRAPLPGAATVAAAERTMRVVDAATGEPVPEFVVAAPALDPPLRVSGPDAILHLGAVVDPAVELRLLDDARLRLEQPIACEVVDDELRVHIGPTYRLLLSPPPRPNELFDARLVALDPLRQHRTAFAPVRNDDRPWVRFAADATNLRAGPPWRLEVRSDDGYRFGHAEVHSVRGIHREPVVVALADTGRLIGRVAQPDGSPVDQAEVELTAGEHRFVASTDGAGAFDVAWLPPATYALRVSSRRHAPVAAEAAVAARATTAVEHTLHPLPAHGVVEGELISEGGAGARPVPGPIAVVLTSPDDPERSFVQTVACAAPPERVLARFRFERVPAGSYDLTVRAPDFVRWDPATRRVAVDEPGVVLRRLDAEPAADLELRAVDVRTGAALAEYTAFVRLDRDARQAKVLAAEGGRLVLRHVPLAATLEWTIRAPGRAPAHGDRAAAAAPVGLEPGWGNTLRCIDRHGVPLPRLQILGDGLAMGTTGEDGVLRAVRASPPQRLAVRDQLGRTLPAGGDVFADGSFRDLIWGITAVVDAAGPRDPASSNETRR